MLTVENDTRLNKYWYRITPPQSLRRLICMCPTFEFKSDQQTDRYQRCSTCKKISRQYIYKCDNTACVRIFILDFSIPGLCTLHPLCYLCGDEFLEGEPICREHHPSEPPNIRVQTARYSPQLTPIPIRHVDLDEEVLEFDL